MTGRAPLLQKTAFLPFTSSRRSRARTPITRKGTSTACKTSPTRPPSICAQADAAVSGPMPAKRAERARNTRRPHTCASSTAGKAAKRVGSDLLRKCAGYGCKHGELCDHIRQARGGGHRLSPQRGQSKAAQRREHSPRPTPKRGRADSRRAAPAGTWAASARRPPPPPQGGRAAASSTASAIRPTDSTVLTVTRAPVRIFFCCRIFSIMSLSPFP